MYTEAEQDEDLVKSLAPLLRKYAVTAYIDGHDHSMQYISFEGVNYVIAGTGSKLKNRLPDDSSSDAERGVQFTSLAAGFGAARVNARSLELSLIDSSGRILFSQFLYDQRHTTTRFSAYAQSLLIAAPVLSGVQWTVPLAVIVIGLYLLARSRKSVCCKAQHAYSVIPDP